MALSGLDIYKLLPKTNCRDCGFVTCLAFAMQLAKKAVSIDKCPYLSEESKKILEESGQPPIKLVTIGTGDKKIETGNETVLFRHEEKFHHPTAIGYLIEDNLSESQINSKVAKINDFKFDRVGEILEVNIIALKQTGTKENFVKALNTITRNTNLAIAIISSDIESFTEAAKILKDKKPLFIPLLKDYSKIALIAKDINAAVVVSAQSLDELSEATKELNKLGINEIILNLDNQDCAEKIWSFTQIRRQALKKSNRALGYPILSIVDNKDVFGEAIEAASYISKYASIVLIKNIESFQTLALLTLRQNIYTDPQKPLQIEPGLYPIGDANEKSNILITTNFSLSYYTVLGEVEASKIPAYILSVNTEGMSVLTAWAAEKFTPGKITETINEFSVKNKIKHKNLVIPGYVACMSGDLEEQSGFNVIVGPKEAAGIPTFLKNLK